MNRTGKLNFSFATAALSKAAVLLLQLLAMPVAINQLGVAGFILYGVLVSINSWLLLTTSGLSPALSIEISGTQDISEIKKWTSSAYALFVGVGLSTFLLGTLFNLMVPISYYAPDSANELFPDVMLSITILLIAFLLQSFCIASDAVMSGLERQYLTNLAVMVGCIFSFAAILVYDYPISSPSDLIMVIILPPIIARFLVGTFFTINEGLLSVFSIQSKNLRKLITRSFSFFKAGSLTNFLLHVFPIIVVGRFYPKEIAAQYVALNTLVVLLASFISIVTLPLIPALRASVARGENEWAETGLKWLRRYTFLIIYTSLLCAITIAPMILELMFKDKLLFNRGYVAVTGLYFCTLIWSNYSYSLFAVSDSMDQLAPYFLRKSIFSVLILLVCISLSLYILPFAIFGMSFFMFEYFQVKHREVRI